MKSLFEVSAFGKGRFMGGSTEETFEVISSIKGPLISARREAAENFKLYSDASKRRVEAVDALGKAEAALSAAQKIYESTHKNEAQYVAAQTSVDTLAAGLEAVKGEVATYRALVDQNAALIAELWRLANQAVASLPSERQAEGREMLAICAVNMGGTCLHGDSELGCKKCQKGRKRKIYDPFKTQMLGQVSLAGRKQVGQFEVKPVVNVNPNFEIKAPINLDLGGLPLSIGLFAGGALSFFVQGSLPKGWPKYTALAAGTALSAAGIWNLMTAKAKADDAAAKKAAPPPPRPPPVIQPTSAQGGTSASEYQPAAANLLGQVSARIVSPKDYDTIDIGPLTGTYPVRVELQNPTQSPIPFVLELVAQEEGVYGPPEQASHTSQVTVNPGATDVDVKMPIVSGHVLDTVAVTLTAYKRRSAQDPAEMLDMKTFLVK
jgi:hypothetical protein